jgi:hypothetical protein
MALVLSGMSWSNYVSDLANKWVETWPVEVLEKEVRDAVIGEL